MDREQALEILRASSRIGSASASAPITVDADTSPGCGHTAARRPNETDRGSVAACCDSDRDAITRSICRGVLLRLAALRDRIRAAGRAVLPPSRAVMGPPFVPALDFLRGLVLDAAASNPAAGDANGAAAAADDAEMEAYAAAASGGGGGGESDDGARKRARTGP
jgi:hypothetical protein